MWSFADPVVLAWRLDWWGGFDGGGVSVGRGGARECAMRPDLVVDADEGCVVDWSAGLSGSGGPTWRCTSFLSCCESRASPNHPSKRNASRQLTQDVLCRGVRTCDGALPSEDSIDHGSAQRPGCRQALDLVVSTGLLTFKIIEDGLRSLSPSRLSLKIAKTLSLLACHQTWRAAHEG